MSGESNYAPLRKTDITPYLERELPVGLSYVPPRRITGDSVTDEACRRIVAGETSFEIESSYTSEDGNVRVDRTFRFRGSK